MESWLVILGFIALGIMAYLFFRDIEKKKVAYASSLAENILKREEPFSMETLQNDRTHLFENRSYLPKKMFYHVDQVLGTRENIINIRSLGAKTKRRKKIKTKAQI